MTTTTMTKEIPAITPEMIAAFCKDHPAEANRIAATISDDQRLPIFYFANEKFCNVVREMVFAATR